MSSRESIEGRTNPYEPPKEVNALPLPTCHKADTGTNATLEQVSLVRRSDVNVKVDIERRFSLRKLSLAVLIIQVYIASMLFMARNSVLPAFVIAFVIAAQWVVIGAWGYLLAEGRQTEVWWLAVIAFLAFVTGFIVIS